MRGTVGGDIWPRKPKNKEQHTADCGPTYIFAQLSRGCSSSPRSFSFGLFLFAFLQSCGLNPGPHTCQARTTLLSYTPAPFVFCFYFETEPPYPGVLRRPPGNSDASSGWNAKHEQFQASCGGPGKPLRTHRDLLILQDSRWPSTCLSNKCPVSLVALVWGPKR